MTNEERSFRIDEKAGRFFGFPQCCIDEYKVKQVLRNFPWRPGEKEIVGDKGFRPCEMHYKQIILGDIKLEDIISDRKCSTPFPFPKLVTWDLKNLKEFMIFEKRINI